MKPILEEHLKGFYQHGMDKKDFDLCRSRQTGAQFI